MFPPKKRNNMLLPPLARGPSGGSIGSPSPTDEAAETVSVASSVSSMSSMRRKTFPEQLMHIINEEARSSTSNSISWMPDGKSFAILDPSALTAQVLPKYFPRCKLDSFVRKLHRWGFRKAEVGYSSIPKGLRKAEVDKMQQLNLRFYHKYFRRSDPRRCRRMRSSITPKDKPKKAAAGGGGGICFKADDGSEEDSSQKRRAFVVGSHASAPAASNISSQTPPLKVVIDAPPASPLPGSSANSTPQLSNVSAPPSPSTSGKSPVAMGKSTAQATRAPGASFPAQMQHAPQQAKTEQSPQQVSSSAAPTAASHPTTPPAAQMQGVPQLAQAWALLLGGTSPPQGQQTHPALLQPLLRPQTQQIPQAAVQSAQVTTTLLQAVGNGQQESDQRRLTEELLKTALFDVAGHHQRHHPSHVQALAQTQLVETVRLRLQQQQLARVQVQAQAQIPALQQQQRQLLGALQPTRTQQQEVQVQQQPSLILEALRQYQAGKIQTAVMAGMANQAVPVAPTAADTALLTMLYPHLS